MAGKNDPNEEVIEPTDICSKCGSKMIFEDGELVCPHCDGEIDYFGDEDGE